MSDVEEQEFEQNDAVRSTSPAEDEEEEETPKRSATNAVGADFDEDDEDEDEDEDEGEEEEDVGRHKKRFKHRHKRDTINRFIDMEAEVDDEDDEEEEEDDINNDGFIAAGGEDEESSRRHHALLDSRRQFEEIEDQSPEQIARDLNRRYGGRNAVRYNGDLNTIPQRLLMPSVHDASLWQVRVKPGRERDIVFSLMRKAIDTEYTARPVSVLSAFQRDSLPGMIYVEARSSQQVLQACQGLVGVYPSRGVHLVPIDEMASLLQIKKQDFKLQPGSWVRIRRGKYQGDLAQVMDVTENGEDVGLKFLPRIDLNPIDEGGIDGARKRKKGGLVPGTIRPPQRPFNPEEVARVYGRQTVIKRKDCYVFGGETFRDGFLEKDVKLTGLILEDVNPTLDEITQFTRRLDGESAVPVDLSIIAEASRKAAISVLQPGDHIEVFEGEQAGVHGVVEEISGDVVTITASGVDIEGQKVELPARSVRKRFKPGDHVKVMTGKNADETGLVVSVTDNVVTFLSDMSMQEISVFSKDLREAAEVGSGTNIVGEYELHDLVQLDQQTVGVIFKTERDSFRVLDQNGQVRLVQPHQISMRRDSRRAIATDANGHEIRKDDNMKETEGEGRRGRVLHIHQSFYAFLHNRDISENGGVFVTRTRSLVSLAPKVIQVAGTDLSKMNPAVGSPTGGMVGSGNMGRGPRDRLIGTNVVIVKGPQKGYIGIIKDTNGPMARVELNTGNKLISIDKEKLRKRLPNGTTEPLEGGFPRGGQGRGGGSFNATKSINPYTAGGSRTPAHDSIGATPNPYNASSRTPGWGAAQRTPNPYLNSGSTQTPAWNASSKTPNPYAADGGRTPAWNVGSKTPNPYNGSATPARSGWATPARSSGGLGNDGWASPARQQPWSAPTPAAAPTPAFGAPTPAFAPTPGLAAPTPGSYLSAPTPGGIMKYMGDSSLSAPTPGAMDIPFNTGYQPYEVPSNWFVHPELMLHQKRIRVEIRGTRPDNYLNGDYEAMHGRIMGATSVGSNYEQTAMVQFGSGDSRSIAGKYIWPEYPEKAGVDVLVIHGRRMGEIVKVREIQENEMATVSSLQTGTFDEIPRDRLTVVTSDT